ncbi:MAG: type VI secretion system contractile sheath small subunit, partial [Planctomycetota bacterium]
MSEGVSLGNVDFELSTLASFALRKAKDNVPFCMAVLADFTGRGNSGLRETGPPLAARRRILVDVDNLDELPGKLGCGLHIPLMGKDDLLFSIAFRELSDFHPD